MELHACSKIACAFRGQHTRGTQVSRLICSWCVPYIIANGLLSKERHGFMARKSCVTQFLTTLEGWTALLQNGILVDIVYLDFSKAFNSVPHQHL